MSWIYIFLAVIVEVCVILTYAHLHTGSEDYDALGVLLLMIGASALIDVVWLVVLVWSHIWS